MGKPKAKRNQSQAEFEPSSYDSKRNYQGRPQHEKPRPLNEGQQYYMHCLESCPIVIAIGCPGTSKTFLPSALGAYWMVNKDPSQGIRKIVIARKPEKHSNGYLPGTFQEKIQGLMVPVLDAIKTVIKDQTKVDYLLAKGDIEFCNLDEIKGRTFNDTMLIVDEAEDCDEATMKAILTRIGHNTKIVLTGDIKQCNLRHKSGLQMAIDLSKVVDFNMPVIEFGIDDIVRSDTCRDVIVGMVKLGLY